MSIRETQDRKRYSYVSVAIASAGALLLVYALPLLASPQPAEQPRIADLAWIAGHWGTEIDGEVLDEAWSKPEGDCMMGMFRWTRKGKVWLYELLTFREEQDTIVFRFRHFSGELTAWEAKKEPLTFKLLSLSDGEAIFENPERDHPRRFIFRRENKNALTVRMEGYDDGKLAADEFHYRRR